MNQLAEAELEEETEIEIEEKSSWEKRRVVSMEDPFQAFKIITHEANLDYIKKLSALLDTITKAMS